MGTGVIDALSFYNAVEDGIVVQDVTMESILKTGERCTTSLYVNNDLIKACEIFEVSVDSFEKTESEYYVVFEVPEGQSMLTSNGSVVASSTESTFLLKDVDITASNYGVQVCSDAAGTSCDSGVLVDLKDDEIDLPADCSFR